MKKKKKKKGKKSEPFQFFGRIHTRMAGKGGGGGELGGESCWLGYFFSFFARNNVNIPAEISISLPRACFGPLPFHQLLHQWSWQWLLHSLHSCPPADSIHSGLGGEGGGGARVCGTARELPG